MTEALAVGRSIPWWEPLTGEEEKDLLCKVVDSQFLNDGEFTREFERKVAAVCGTKYAVAVTSGTVSLTVALMACGVEPGDEVIVPDLTFIATANAVKLAGAVPVLVDVRRDDFTIDVEEVARAVSPRTRAVIPVHVNGRRADMESLTTLGKAERLAIVEDAAEALGSRWHGRYLGAFADAGCFSFTPTKIITTGQGGMVVTDREDVYRRLIELKDQGRPQRGSGGDDLHPAIGYNFKLSNLQAAVGIAQMAKLEARIARMKELHKVYVRELAGLEGISVVPFMIAAGISPQWIDALVDRRDELAAFLADMNIGTRNFWLPIHTQPCYKGYSECPNASWVSKRGLWLPSSLTMSDDEAFSVCEAIRQFYG